MADDTTKSWFAVFDNPQDHGYAGEPQEVVDRLIEEWIFENPTRTCAMTFCVSAQGLRHVHMVLEDTKTMRFSLIKKTFAIGMHFEPTKGTKQQAEEYISKKGVFEEKGEIVLYSNRHGEIKACNGARNEFEIISQLILLGHTPFEIMNMSFSYRRYETMIKNAYYDKRKSETPFLRDIDVVWHVGESGSGKSYQSKILADTIGEDKFYFVSDYDSGGLDKYNGESILFMDEFRGQIRYSTLLSMLQGYKTEVHARYTNITGLWDIVHITSVLPPESVYSNMVKEHQELDTIQQLKRRITTIIYHYKVNGEYNEFSLPMVDYVDYDSLKSLALGDKNGFINIEQLDLDIPFD